MSKKVGVGLSMSHMSHFAHEKYDGSSESILFHGPGQFSHTIFLYSMAKTLKGEQETDLLLFFYFAVTCIIAQHQD